MWCNSHIGNVTFLNYNKIIGRARRPQVITGYPFFISVSYTHLFEVIGSYSLPVKEQIQFQYSYNLHHQNSIYGTLPYLAKQHVGFAQLIWDKKLGEHNALIGLSSRYTFYDDNTPGTLSSDGNSNKPDRKPINGFFIQDEINLNKNAILLAGYRYDYDIHHGHIHSPRLAYKYAPDLNTTFRLSMGTGFRVVNLFTEDHAALTGSRQVVIAENLNPERSYNATLNIVKKIYLSLIHIYHRQCRFTKVQENAIQSKDSLE